MISKITTNIPKVTAKVTEKWIELMANYCQQRAKQLLETASYSPYRTGRTAASIEKKVFYDPERKAFVAKIGYSARDPEILKVGIINEYGTGPRGDESWEQYGNEKKPEFSLPFIRPVSSPVMVWLDWLTGDPIFATKTKGRNPHPHLRPALYETKHYAERYLKEAIKLETK